MKILEAERQAQSEANDRKQKKIEAERAKFEKAINIATATANFGVALSKTFAMSGFTPWAIAQTVAMAVVQAATLAKIAATKIPSYAEGTQDHPGGLALVGEGKHPEIIETPAGKPFIADNPILMNLPKHSKVTPIKDDVKRQVWQTTYSISSGIKEQENAVQMYQSRKLESAINKQTFSLVDAIKRKQPIKIKNNTNVDLGWAKYISEKIYGRKL